jgi:hypothetical protein
MQKDGVGAAWLCGSIARQLLFSRSSAFRRDVIESRRLTFAASPGEATSGIFNLRSHAGKPPFLPRVEDGFCELGLFIPQEFDTLSAFLYHVGAAFSSQNVIRRTTEFPRRVQIDSRPDEGIPERRSSVLPGEGVVFGCIFRSFSAAGVRHSNHHVLDNFLFLRGARTCAMKYDSPAWFL